MRVLVFHLLVFSVISKGHITPLKQRYNFEAKKQAIKGKHYTHIGEMFNNPDKSQISPNLLLL